MKGECTQLAKRCWEPPESMVGVHSLRTGARCREAAGRVRAAFMENVPILGKGAGNGTLEDGYAKVLEA